MEHMKWSRLGLMAAVSFASMFILMYMMVDTGSDVVVNVNEFYMAAAMTGAMMVIEMFVMKTMYPTAMRRNVIVAGTLALILGVLATRTQFAVGDQQFLRSMIPHHGAALLMCKETKLQDPEIQKLCDGIIASQQSEIDWMKAKLSSK